MSFRSLRRSITAVIAGLGVSAVSRAQSAVDMPRFDPGAFRGGPVDNPLFPLKPRAVYVFRVREDDDVSIDSITVTSDTKRIAGVLAVVVRPGSSRREADRRHV